MRSVITLAVGALLFAALIATFGASAASAAALLPVAQDVPAAPAAVNAVDVSVSAKTGFTRTYQWAITKTASINPLPLFAGESDVISYTVTGQRDILQSGSHISGTVLITNPSGVSATTLNTVTVKLTSPNVGSVPVDCGVTLPYALAANGVLECSFGSLLPGVSSRPTTTVSVFSDGNATPDTAVTVPMATAPKVVGFNSVTVLDSYAGNLGKLPTPGSNGTDFTVDYARPVECTADPAEYVEGLRQIPLENTATISETDQIAVADVLVNCIAPAVSQQVAGGFTRTWSWAVDKSADKSSSSVNQGGALPISYSVAVSNTKADTDYAVDGVISVTNQHPTKAMPVNLSSTIPGLPPVTLQCANALNVPADSTVTCAFSADNVPDGTQRQSVATATFAGGNYVSTVPVSFAPTNEVDECVDVFDDDGTPGDPGSDTKLGTVCRDEAPEPFTYTANPVFNTCGAQQFVNTVRLAGSETAQPATDSWTVSVNVSCDPSANQKVLLPLVFNDDE